MIGEDFFGKDLVLGILKKDPGAIVPAEREILEARRGYLSEEEKKRYGVGEFAPKASKVTKSKKK